MARLPKRWYRQDRAAWFVTIAGVRHNLRPNKLLPELINSQVVIAESIPVVTG
jgi:hypothetical protein